MFDDLNDDDVTDLIPDSDLEKKEKKRHREQEQKGRRMTVSEVSKIEKSFCFFKDSGMNLSDYAVKCRFINKDFLLRFTNLSIKIVIVHRIAWKHFEYHKI